MYIFLFYWGFLLGREAGDERGREQVYIDASDQVSTVEVKI